MTDRSAALSRGASSKADVAAWLNISGATVPAYGVVQFKNNFASGYNQASKPNGRTGVYYANGPVDVTDGGYGESLIWNHSRLVLIEGTPTVGTVVGPTEDSWQMSEAGSGFIVLHQPVDGVGAVVQLGGGSSNILHGIVNEVLERGYYLIELAEWDGTTPVAGETEDPCEQMTGSFSGSIDDNCSDITLPEFISQLSGTGEFVLAYDPQSYFVPLVVGSDVKLVDMGDENPLGSQPESSGTFEPVFQIIRGFQNHIAEYKDEKDCCNGVWTLLSRKAIIFAAKVCDVAVCTVCEETPP